mgnify:FL=1
MEMKIVLCSNREILFDALDLGTAYGVRYNWAERVIGRAFAISVEAIEEAGLSFDSESSFQAWHGGWCDRRNARYERDYASVFLPVPAIIMPEEDDDEKSIADDVKRLSGCAEAACKKFADWREPHEVEFARKEAEFEAEHLAEAE